MSALRLEIMGYSAAEIPQIELMAHLMKKSIGLFDENRNIKGFFLKFSHKSQSAWHHITRVTVKVGSFCGQTGNPSVRQRKQLA